MFIVGVQRNGRAVWESGNRKHRREMGGRCIVGFCFLFLKECVHRMLLSRLCEISEKDLPYLLLLLYSRNSEGSISFLFF